MDKVTVCQLSSPFPDAERRVAVVEPFPGATVPHYLDEVRNLPEVKWAVSVTSQDRTHWRGVLGEVEHWPVVRPGDFIAVCPILEDGDVLRILAMVAVIMVAPQFGAWLGESLVYGIQAAGYGTYAAAAAIGTGLAVAGGAALVNAVLPPSAPDVPQIGSDPFKESPTYGWGDLRATEGQGRPVQLLFGKMRVSGQILSKFVTVSGDKQYLHVLIGVADTEGVDSVAISKVEINGQDASHFQGVTTYTRPGGLNDAVIPGFDQIVAQIDHGVKLTTANLDRTTTGNEVETIEIDLVAPYGLFYSNDGGGLDNRQAVIEVWYGLAGGAFVKHGTATLSGATTQAVRQTYTIDNLSAGQYEFRLRRTNAESTSYREKTTIFLASHREVIKQNLTYPGIAKVAVTALATDQLSGGVPSITFLAERTYVQVYNPHTGSWSARRADNLAWAYYAFWTTHQGVDPSLMLYDEIAAWAAHCDEIIRPEDGGAEKRYCLDLYLDVQANAWTNAQQICRIGRAQPIRRGSKYGVVADMPAVPRQLFTTGSVTNFKLTYLGQEDRANAVEISYYDKDLDYSRQVVTIVSPDYDQAGETDNKTSRNAYGSTSRGQVVRSGVADLNSNAWEIRDITFDVDVAALATQVGDLFYFMHDAPTWGDSGRIVAAGTVTITLDREVTLLAGEAYAILISRADGVILDKALAQVSALTTTATLTFAAALDPSDVPARYDEYSFGPVQTYKRTYRCTRLSRTHDLKKTVSGREYSELLSQDTVYLISPPDTPKTKAKAYAVSASEYLSMEKDGTTMSQISVSWLAAATDPAQAWEVWLEDMSSGGSAMGPFPAHGLRYVVPPSLLTIGHTYKITVVAAGKGLISTGGNTAQVSIDGKSDGPPDVDAFSVSCQADGTREFSWSMAYRPPDLAGFRIRYKTGTNGTWEEMTDLSSGLVVMSPLETNALEAGDYLFGIKAVDWSGNESTAMRAIVGSLGDPRMGQAIYAVNARPTWPGTKTGCHVEGSQLVANDQTTWDGLPATWDQWTTWFPNPLAQLTYEHPAIDLGSALQVTMIATAVATGTAVITMNTSTDNQNWSGWVSLGMVKAQYIKIKVVVTDNTSPPPTLSSLSIVVTGQTKTEEVNDLSTSGLPSANRVAAGHIYLPLTKPFSVVTQVMIAMQGVTAGWSSVVINKARTVSGALAPEIKIYNASGVLADAVIDAYVRGV